MAVYNGRTKIVSLLLERGADVRAKDTRGWTPLHGAAWYNYTEVCELLLQYGADANAKDYEGKTAYDVASENGKKACRRLLKQHM